MAEKMSTGLCNKLLDTGSLKATFNTARIRIYSGTPPATADAALSGNTLLVEIADAGSNLTWDTAASGGVLAKAGASTYSGTNAATGTATFYRLVNNADAGGSSTTDPRIQGTVGTGGTDMVLGSTALVSGATTTLNYWTQAFVPS